MVVAVEMRELDTRFTGARDLRGTFVLYFIVPYTPRKRSHKQR